MHTLLEQHWKPPSQHLAVRLHLDTGVFAVIPRECLGQDSEQHIAKRGFSLYLCWWQYEMCSFEVLLCLQKRTHKRVTPQGIPSGPTELSTCWLSLSFLPGIENIIPEHPKAGI